MMIFSKSKTIENLFYKASSGADGDSFIGIKIRGNEIYFYYPQAYHFVDDEKCIKRDIISILNTINIAKTKSVDSTDIYTGRINETDFALDSYLWVIKDYVNNGIYVNREKMYKYNQNGKVNWKRTLDGNPMVSKTGNVIYQDIIVDVKNQVDNIIVDIHKYCIKKSIDLIGWLFNLNSKFIHPKHFNSQVKKHYLIALKKEISHTFDDDKKIRLNHFLNIIQGLDDDIDEKDFVYGVDRYDYVYERMIDYIFGNEDVTKFYPRGRWLLVKNNFTPINSSNLRPDTILSNGRDIYILDAKFYRFGVTGDEKHLPETSSIQKQILYGDYIKNKMPSEFDNVYNAFLIPFDMQNETFKTNDILYYIGYSRTDANEAKLPHEKIHTFLIDLKHVIECWNRSNRSDDREKIIQSIQIQINSFKK